MLVVDLGVVLLWAAPLGQRRGLRQQSLVHCSAADVKVTAPTSGSTGRSWTHEEELADREIDHELEVLLDMLVGLLGFESRGQQVGHARHSDDALLSVHGGTDGCKRTTWRLQAVSIIHDGFAL
jgi:hypothetical protein